MTVVLTQNLFILLPHLHDALVHLRHGCIDLLHVHLFAFESERERGIASHHDHREVASDERRLEKTYTLTEFSSRLKAQKMVCERLVDQFIAQSGIIAKQACEQFLYDFLQGTGFNSKRTSHDNSPKATPRRVSLYVNAKEEARRKSVLAALPQADPERTMTYTERATMRTQCRRMTQFLRVVEFYLSDALLQMAVASVERLRREMASLSVSVGGQQRDAGEGKADVRKGPPRVELGAFSNQHRNSSSVPLFRVEVALESAAPPSLGTTAVGSVWSGSSRARIVRRNSGLLTLPLASKLPSPVRELRAGSSDQLAFAPTTELLRSQVETLIFNGLKAVTNRERLLCNPMFRAYVELSWDDSVGASDDESDTGELASESMDVEILILEDVAFVETLQGINAILLDAYDRADVACRVLSPFFDKYKANVLFGRTLSDPRCFEHADADTFRELLDKYVQEIELVDELPDESSCGLLLLDKVKLNAVLKPTPRRCLERLELLIPIVIRQKNDNFMRELSESNDRISAIPSSVDEFAATLAYLRQLQASMDDLDDRYAVLKNLYQLVDDFTLKLTDADHMNVFLVSQKRTQLRTSMELFENSCDQYTTKFGIELEARIPGLAVRLVAIAQSLAHASLFQLESAPDDVIVYLSTVAENLRELEDVVEKHLFHEQTLALPQTTAFEELSDVKADLVLKMDLWQALSSWTHNVQQWERLEFPTEVDVPGIAEQIHDTFARILAWETRLSPGMHVLCAHLKASVNTYRVTMPILSNLQCPSFETRHFTELETLLNFSLRAFDCDNTNRAEGGSTLTLGQLVAMQLAPFGPQISRITTEATQERLLKEALDKLVAMWDHMKFDVKAYKDAKDAYVLVAYETIYASLEESLVSLTAILSSKYLAPIKDVALTWQNRLTVFQETLDAWIECQRKWMHLESIFAAPDIQKQLPNEAMLFVSVNQFWKDLMRRARDQQNCLKVSGAIFAGVSTGTTVASGAGHAVLDTMVKHNMSLERIEKSLEDYLETKRGFFPRFYFISNDELLEILTHAKEPQAVQRHLCKCFDALVKLELSGGDASHHATAATTTTHDIVAMVSPEGERVTFGRSLKARGNVEDWLTSVLTTMRTTLHRAIKTCLLDYQHGSRETWIFRHPAQAVAVVSYIMWARECEVCFRSPSHDPQRELQLWHQTICLQLSNLTRLVRSSLTRLQRSLVVSLVTTDVHCRDVVDELVAKNVASADDFVWTQQLRYYWHADHDECDVLQANCTIKYGYEYMGACSRLVITPLTDRCWMTITGALELRFGAAPSGPAGTGKTETSKDLAKALGILCIVFNCSDQIDYKMVGKIFNGVIQAGCWVCLDEFNRIDIEVLSVVAQQMHVLRTARLLSSASVYFEGRHVALREHHIIITMNPGYVGRTELPDNLKLCFRPVAMMVPDYAQIAEILLFAEGFQTALVLSKKITKLFKLCSEQLSQQPHYDFGMRSVKSVLTIAGTLKRATATASLSLANHVDENVVLIRAMYDANVSKLVDADSVLFRGILRDLFPETLATASGADDTLFGSTATGVGIATWMASLAGEVDNQLAHHGLQVAPKWKKKVVELFTTLDVRVGVVQTGASGSGKSTATRVLKDALTTLRDRKAHPSGKFQRVVSFVLNPKAISMAELYGFFHPVTREWTDGLASSILRACIAEKSKQLLSLAAEASPSDGGPYYWITFDGPIDVLWVESMNTVLDDNMTLCLANGERIKLLPRIHLLFEVLDTASASPATISRLGVVYYHPSYLGWRPYVESWVATLAVPMARPLNDTTASAETTLVRLNATHRARILQYFDTFIDAGIAFVRTSGHPNTAPGRATALKVPIHTSDLTFVTSVCHLFQSLLLYRVPPELFVPVTAASIPGGSSATAAAVAALEHQQLRCLDLLFVFSYAWSFGGNLHVDEYRKAFQDFVLTQLQSHEPLLSPDLLAIHGKIPTPHGMTQVTDNIHDFFIDFQHMSFSPWTNVVHGAVAYDPDRPLSQVLVPTVDVVRYSYLTELLVLDARKPVLLTGATGVGKSMLVKHLIDATRTSGRRTTDNKTLLPIFLQFSAQTSSAVTQLSLESKFVKKRKTLLGAPPNTDLVVIVIDDINLPTAERLGAQPPIELLRQYLEFQGFYDRDKFFWKDVADSVLLAVGGLPGGGRHTLCPRLVRHFAAVLCLPTSDDDTMRTIFRAILSEHVTCNASVTKSVRDVLLLLVDATCQLYSAVARELLPSPSKYHYLFNLRDVAKLLQGVVFGTQRFFGGDAKAPATTATPLASALTADSVTRLWAHESIRVFRDRLVDEPDRRCFSEHLVAVASTCLGYACALESFYDPVGRDTTDQQSGGEPMPFVPLLFGVPPRCRSTQHRPNGHATATESGHVYEEITDLMAFEAELDSAMEQYNESSHGHGRGGERQLVFFRDAIVHVVAISRILHQPRGHALLLGMGGAGKRSLTRVSAFLNGYRCVEIDMKKPYGVTEFRDDLKAAMLETVLVGTHASRGDDSKSRALASSTRAGDRASAIGHDSSTPTVLLLNDSQLVSGDLVDDVNTLLSGGEIPKLFTLEEREKIIADVRLLLLSPTNHHDQQAVVYRPTNLPTKTTSADELEQTLSTPPPAELSRVDCETFFFSQVHNHLHLALCLSHTSDAFRARVQAFPSLIHGTTIVAFDAWPTTALQYVADRYLSSHSSGTRSALDDATKRALTGLCVEVHRSVGSAAAAFAAQRRRRAVIAPPHFLDLIALFQRLETEKRAQLHTKLQRLTTGVVTLDATNALVTTLQDELVALQPGLVEKAREAELLLQRVSIDQAEASTAAAQVASDESRVKQQQKEVAACQADAQSELDRALPALHAAVTALDSLDKKDITEVKGFVKPPQAVQVVMEAVCIMLGEKPDWDTSKRVLSRSSLLFELKEYDKDSIAPAVLKRMRKYIESPEFAVDEVKKVSRAAMSLCMWVHAVDTYARVYKDVAPKRQRLADMNTVLATANATLAAKQHELSRVLASVRELQDQCDATLAAKQRLVDESELTQARLERAERLTAGLSDERVRWKRIIEQLKAEGAAVVGNAFLAAASIAYLGPFDGSFRADVLRDWVAVAASLSFDVASDFALVDVVGDAVELREWQLLGLPSDAVSAENAISIRKHSERWPLLIDPQQQASQWLKRLEASCGLCMVKCSDNALTRVLEQCLRSGTPLLVEDVPESLESSLEPVLCRGAMLATGSNSGLAIVKLGDRVVDVDPLKFRLYLTTKLANPAFAPDVFIRTNVINFTVTREGLEGQLLSDVVKRERPEVEARKHALLTSIATDQKLLYEIERAILRLLSESDSTILDDQALVEALETSKQTALVVTRRLAESQATQLEVLDIRDQYASIAARGALLYFAVADLGRLDSMYQYSLEYFTRLFNASVDTAPSSAELSQRLASLEAHLTLVVYRNICRGLFEAHKLLFSLVVCLRVQVMSGEVSDRAIRLLDASSTTTKLGEVSDRDAHSGAGSRLADAGDVLIALADAHAPFQSVLESYELDPSAWRSWIASASPYVTSLPSGCDDRLSLFDRLVLVRWLCSDTFVDATRRYISDRLGDCFVTSESFAMADVFSDMDNATPCLFILSSGADPKGVLDRFARAQSVYDAKYHVISLGQGQGPAADARMEQCRQDGHWLALLNVHLAKSWLLGFQLQLAATTAERLSNVHSDYRLFLASFPATYFPIAILQNSVKVICEPPKGIKANVRRSMTLLLHAEEAKDDTGDNDDDATAEDAPRTEAVWFRNVQLQLAFGLSFFHAVVQERAKFGALGWNLPYDFSDSDFLSVLALQKRLLHSAHSSVSRKSRLARNGSTLMMVDVESTDALSAERYRVPWDALHFLTAEIYYGGRVTDEFDRRCLVANLLRFCSPATLALGGYSANQDDPAARLFPLADDQFCCPAFRDHREMSAFVDSLPPLDAPFVFGMHPNAHMYFQEQETQRLVAELLLLHPAADDGDRDGRDRAAVTETMHASGGGVASQEDEVVRRARELQTKLPRVPDGVSDATLSTSSSDSSLIDPLLVVLQQEQAKCHALLQFVHDRLDVVERALRGVVAMSHSIEAVVRSLVTHQVPLEWRRMDGSSSVSTFTAFAASSTSLSLSHWVTQLRFRFEFLHSWRTDGRPPHNVFPLSIFSFPQGFFTALLQRHARKYVVPIHHLEFHFDVVSSEPTRGGGTASAAYDTLGRQDDDDDDKEETRDGDTDGQVTDGAYISGLLLEGARWDGETGRLCDPEPGVRHHIMPPIHVLPRAVGDAVSASAPSTTTSKGGGTVASTPRVASSLLLSAPSSQRKSTLDTTAARAVQVHAEGLRSPSLATRATVAPATAFKYACPVYKTPARKGALSTTGISTNFVLAIELPCERAPEHYALNGTALVCSITD